MPMQLRSGNSGAPFVGVNALDTMLWDPTALGWYVGPGGGDGAVSSVFGRIGAVVAQVGDYNSDQIDNLSTVSGASVSDALETLALSAGAVASVFGRSGVVVAQAGDYAASQVSNDSGVAGATVKDALQSLAAQSGVTSVYGRTGAVVALNGDYTSSQITNSSTVAGATVTAALNTLGALVGGVSSVFGRAGAVVAVAGDYTSTQITNSSTVAGATVTAALNTLGALVTGVSSVFGRTGAVVAVAGDYTSTQITNSSTVAGATVTAALNALGALATVQSVFGRTGVVVAVAGDYTSTLVTNASTVAGATVTAALNALAALATVQSVFGRTGAVVAVAGDYTSTQITNSSTVAGATVTAALNTLGALATVQSVFGRTGAVVAVAGDYTSTQITNSSTVAGATVTDALNTLGAAVSGFVPTSRTITTTTPLRIDGGNSADLSSNRTLSVLAVSNTTAGVAPLVPGTVGLALISTATASAWSVDFGANTPVSSVGWIANAGAGFLRLGLAPGSGAGAAASQGSIRLPLGAFVGSIYGRNNADNLDVFLFGWSSSSNVVQVGSNGAGGNATLDACALTTFRVKLTTGPTVVMSMTTTAVSYAGINSFSFDGAPTVTLSQAAATGAGKAFTLQAQGGTTTGGDLTLVAGNAGAAANAAGSVNVVPGKGSGDAGNINLGSATVPNYNSMKRGLYVVDSEAIPTSAPTGGSFLYGQSGAGWARSPNDDFTMVWAA